MNDALSVFDYPTSDIQVAIDHAVAHAPNKAAGIFQQLNLFVFVLTFVSKGIALANNIRRFVRDILRAVQVIRTCLAFFLVCCCVNNFVISGMVNE